MELVTRRDGDRDKGGAMAEHRGQRSAGGAWGARSMMWAAAATIASWCGSAWCGGVIGAQPTGAGGEGSGTAGVMVPGAGRPEAPGASLWAMPEGTRASIAATGTMLPTDAGDGTRELLTRVMLALVERSTPARGGGTSVLRALVESGALSGVGWRLVLLDVRAASEVSGGVEGSMRVEGLSAVLEIRSGLGHERLMGIIQRALEADERGYRRPAGVASRVTLPGGRPAVVYRREGDAGWREVSWASLETSLLVGFGAGSLERWIAASAATDPLRAEWLLHRSAALGRAGAMEPMAEVFVDLGGLRRTSPEAFVAGPWRELAEAWGVPNARSVLVLAGRQAGAGAASGGVRIEVCWSSRAEPPGVSRGLTLAQPGLPLSAGALGPEAWAMTLRADWGGMIAMGVDSWSALTSGRARRTLEADRQTYERTRGASLRRTLGRLGDTVAIGGDAARVVARWPLREAASTPEARRALVSDLRQAMQIAGEWVSFDPGATRWVVRGGVVRGERAVLPRDLWITISPGGEALEARWSPEEPSRR